MVMSFNKQKLVNGYLLVANKLLLERFSFFNHDSKAFQYFTNVNQGNKELAKLSRNLRGANLFLTSREIYEDKGTISDFQCSLSKFL